MKIKHLGMTFIKGTRFLEVRHARVAGYGFAGDREFVLVNERGALLAPEQHAPFLPLVFDFDDGENRLMLRFPDGRAVSEPLQLAERAVDLDYLGMRTIALRKVLGDWDSHLAGFSGRKVQLYRCDRPGAGIDIKPITLLTTGSIRRLAQSLGAEVDHRRFRANIIIDHDRPHAEDEWNGAILTAGTARLRVLSSVPRCVVTQLDPDTGHENQRVVRALQGYRDRVRMPDGLMPRYATPGFASYAEVVVPGEVTVGDAISVDLATPD